MIREDRLMSFAEETTCLKSQLSKETRHNFGETTFASHQMPGYHLRVSVGSQLEAYHTAGLNTTRQGGSGRWVGR